MKLRLATLVALLALQPVASSAQPSPFDSIVSDVKIERNGEIEVVTTAKIHVNGNKQRGIFTILPLSGDPCANPPRAVGARIISITRNGTQEKYVVERAPPEKPGPNIIRIGRPDRLLDDGSHVFVIRYRATGQIRTSGRFDEIHWSASRGTTTGVARIEARVRLPEPVQFEKIEFYTGEFRQNRKDAEVIEQEPGHVAIATTNSFPPKHGFTVVLSWKKGVVILPPPSESEIAFAKKQQKQAKEFNCLTSSIDTFDLAEFIPTEFAPWN